jgi:hypothetical protein
MVKKLSEELENNPQISFTEVVDILFECLKFKVEDLQLLDICIHTILKSYRNNFGNYKEYFSFKHTHLKKQILNLYEYRRKKT